MAGLKVASATSGGSVMGLITLERALRRQGVEVVRHESADLRGIDGLPEGFDVGLIHNTLSVSDGVLRRSVVFALQTVVNKMTRGENAGTVVDRLRRAPPLEFWCNTDSATRAIRELGFKARTMYRPAPSFERPREYARLPEARRVLWYYDPPHRFMKAKLPAIRDLLGKIDDSVEVLLFPSDECPVDRPNVRALGRIDLEEWLPKVRGMVRVSDHLDYGRSTFDVLAHGRWVLYYDMDESISYSAPTLEEMPGRILELLEEEGDAEGRVRHARAAQFDLSVQGPVWADRLAKVASMQTIG